MPASTYPHNFLDGLSDFWTRFFADSPQLQELYNATAVVVGQSYLDLLASVLNISLQDTPVFNREYYRLVALREDQVLFKRGLAPSDDRWVAALEDGLVTFASLDNRVLRPTAALQEDLDFDIVSRSVYFKVDPTDPLHDGVPLSNYARRLVDVATGGAFDDTTRTVTQSWKTRGVYKGDVLRLLLVNSGGAAQHKQSDHTITLIRDTALHISESTPLPKTTAAQNYVILRTPGAPQVTLEPLTFVGTTATLAHIRIDEGSVRVYAKRSSDGADVVEDVDYSVDYENGVINKLSTWAAWSVNKVDYTWKQEIWPAVNPPAPPRYSTTGVIRSTPLSGTTPTVSVYQLAFWAPDARVDRYNLANNYGSIIGVEQDSSESYRAFLRGLFQLYILGPVLERLESALNVVLGLPTVRVDGEVFVGIDYTNPSFNRITTSGPDTGVTTFYDFPNNTPLRADLTAGSVLHAFEPLTTAATVTDYIQDATWWYTTVIPQTLFNPPAGPPIKSAQGLTITKVDATYARVTVNTPTFTVDDVGRALVIAGATTVTNNGTFAIYAYVSPTEVTYVNPEAVGTPFEAYNGTCSVRFTIPTLNRRTVSPNLVQNVINAPDNPAIGDPGLLIGADETGFQASFPGQPVYRRRVAFVLMDRFFKYHTFYVKFDPGVFSGTNTARYARSFDDIQNLVLTAKPAHTYAFVTPVTSFYEEVYVAEAGYYQPPNQLGQNPDGPELFPDITGPDPLYPYVQLGLFFSLTAGSPPGADGADQVVIADGPPVIGRYGWTIGDYFHYEDATAVVSFPLASVAVALTAGPPAPRRGRLVKVFVGTTIGGKALVEGIDYSVDYANLTVTRLTNWTVVLNVSIQYVLANIGNVADAPADTSVGDVPLLIGGNDPATMRADYSQTAVDWFGNIIYNPATYPDHRDMSLVERPLTITIGP